MFFIEKKVLPVKRLIKQYYKKKSISFLRFFTNQKIVNKVGVHNNTSRS